MDVELLHLNSLVTLMISLKLSIHFWCLYQEKNDSMIGSLIAIRRFSYFKSFSKESYFINKLLKLYQFEAKQINGFGGTLISFRIISFFMDEVSI